MTSPSGPLAGGLHLVPPQLNPAWDGTTPDEQYVYPLPPAAITSDYESGEDGPGFEGAGRPVPVGDSWTAQTVANGGVGNLETQAGVQTYQYLSAGPGGVVLEEGATNG